jgi:hypothetical protein
VLKRSGNEGRDQSRRWGERPSSPLAWNLTAAAAYLVQVRFGDERSPLVRRTTKLIVLALVVVVAAAALAFVLHYVPFNAPSFLAWTGIAAALAGLASLARPPRWLGVRTRWHALAVALCGAGLAVTAVLWPARVERSARADQRLDRYLAEYQFSEYHETSVRAPLEAVVKAVREVSLADMPAAVVLLRIRAAAVGRFHGSPPDSRPILDTMFQPGSGFLALDLADPGELVYGMVGFVHKPPPVTTPEQFAAFTSPEGLRVVFNLRVVQGSEGVVRISTETRCLANGAAARRTFAGYWRLIYPGSAIIRRVWLDAIVDRAVRATETT